jgi:hypothetical protein
VTIAERPSKTAGPLRAGAGFALGAALNLLIGTGGARVLFDAGWSERWLVALAVATSALEGAIGGRMLGRRWRDAAWFAAAFALWPGIYDLVVGFAFAAAHTLAHSYHLEAVFIRSALGSALAFGAVGAIAALMTTHDMRSALDGLWIFALGGAIQGSLTSALIRALFGGSMAGWPLIAAGIAIPIISMFLAGALFAIMLRRRKWQMRQTKL